MGTDNETITVAGESPIVTALNNLSTVVQTRSDQLRRFNYFVLVVVVFMALLAIWNRDTLNNTNRLIETVDSVTNPTGEQYRQSQLRTQAILQQNAIEADCRNRRRNAGLPAPESGTPGAPNPCTAQTPVEIYPGPTGGN